MPEKAFSERKRPVCLLEIRDPADAFPDYTAATRRKLEANRQRLFRSGLAFRSRTVDLLDNEDALMDALDWFSTDGRSDTVVMDITSLPKRYFCFLLKQMLRRDLFQNVVVTYTEAGTNGYTDRHLAEDPMPCDYLPGYVAPLPPTSAGLVICVGFERLGIRSLLESYRDRKGPIRFILSFPPDGVAAKRQWRTLMEIVSKDPTQIRPDSLETIATWDAEQVYRTLERWYQATGPLTFAPFGAKPHTLAMALFAIFRDGGMYYTQPRAYNPEYSKGHGDSWAYVVKWAGVPCFARP